jgi:hypothetical protein
MRELIHISSGVDPKIICNFCLILRWDIDCKRCAIDDITVRISGFPQRYPYAGGRRAAYSCPSGGHYIGLFGLIICPNDKNRCRINYGFSAKRFLDIDPSTSENELVEWSAL